MKNLKLAYKKLSANSSNVSVHYLISRDGIIFNLLCPKYKAWHAGQSKWKRNTNINDHSIGIELENKGHEFGYTSFTSMQYSSLNKLIKFLKKDFYILDKNILFHSDVAPNRKKDPGEKFLLKQIKINRFKNNKKSKENYNIEDMLYIYGFHKTYINRHKKYCIMAVKRSMNYLKITPSISKIFLKDFYNLLFH